MLLTDMFAEGERIMVICNACRYCEGHCAVFPAMELRTTFPKEELAYLANLCHDCGSCYHHCQYAPPHEFAVNVPKTFKEIRERTYRDHAWPRRRWRRSTPTISAGRPRIRCPARRSCSAWPEASGSSSGRLGSSC